MRNTNVPAGATAGIQGLNENGYVGGTRIWKKITRGGSVVEHRIHIHAGPNLIVEYNSGVAASTTSTYGNPFGYTNRSHDEDSGLMYFRTRHYNPLTGEFLSRDPLEFVDGMSLYRGYFCLVYADPNGTLKLESVNGGPFKSKACTGGYMGIWIILEDDELKKIAVNGGVLIVDLDTAWTIHDCFCPGDPQKSKDKTVTCYPINSDGSLPETPKPAGNADGMQRQYSVAFNFKQTGGFGTWGTYNANWHVDLFPVKPGLTPTQVCEKYFQRNTAKDSRGWIAKAWPDGLHDSVDDFISHETVEVEYTYDYCSECSEDIRSNPPLPAGPNREGK